jgi:hypothetical protein
MPGITATKLIPYLGVAILSGIIGATAMVTFTVGLSTAAVEALSAFGTVALAIFAAFSISATYALINNENRNHRISETVKVLNQYLYSKVPMTREIEVTAHVAHSQIMNAATHHDDFNLAKADLLQHGPTPGNLQYRIVKESFPIVLNFYMNAALLLRQDIIDERVFMNPFAITFLSLWKAMQIVGPVVDANMKPVDALRNFKVRCEQWLAAVKAAGEDTETV